ncbi:MAG: PIN domain-containing protein [Acidimicrobiales bacterium]
MTTLVDTSAIFALLDADDANHGAAARWFADHERADPLITHNYVVVESAALVHRRLGVIASRALFDALLPAFEIVFVDEETHDAAVRAWLTIGTRESSLVDWVSFELVRSTRIDQAFAFDQDFADQGISVVPSG